ncbi:MAG: 30S ribosomal protein S8 [Lysobacterales bacterium]
MSMTDPVSDMLTRIRNAQLAGKKTVSMPTSKLKVGIAGVLKDEGYVVDHHVVDGEKPQLVVELKYRKGRGVIDRLERVSRPGLRCYRGKNDLPTVMGGLGIAIVSTSNGLMTDHNARAAGFGGEVLCVVA